MPRTRSQNYSYFRLDEVSILVSIQNHENEFSRISEVSKNETRNVFGK